MESLPARFPRDVEVIATDLDRTLIWEDGVVRDRTWAAIERARAAGLRVIPVTGRMVQSMRRVIPLERLPEPAVCYQGAVVLDADGTWLRHTPIPTELALETIAALAEEGWPNPNVYLNDELHVAEANDNTRSYAGFQGLAITEVGPLLDWLDTPPTKIVCVGDPAALDVLELRMKARFGSRLWISKSLPYFLEFAAAGVTKGAGLEVLAEKYGFSPDTVVAFGDGENDVELLEWAGYGVAVDNAHARVKAVADWVCPSGEVQGVAQVIERLLDD